MIFSLNNTCLLVGFLIIKRDKEAYPERSVNGSGYSNGDLEHVMILDKGDIELP